MHFGARFGRGGWHWYDTIIIGLAAVIVYPDEVLDWVGERTGLAFSWWHVVLVEGAAIVLMVVAMTLLMPVYPRLQWWYPLLAVGILAAFRGIRWFVTDVFGFGD
jgi:hypothetical protein